jgi:hypothetical protein
MIRSAQGPPAQVHVGGLVGAAHDLRDEGQRDDHRAVDLHEARRVQLVGQLADGLADQRRGDEAR